MDRQEALSLPNRRWRRENLALRASNGLNITSERRVMATLREWVKVGEVLKARVYRLACPQRKHVLAMSPPWPAKILASVIDSFCEDFHDQK